LIPVSLSVYLPVMTQQSSLASRYKLLPNDALIAATCKHYGIGKIASFDPDFEQLEFLELIA
jgi:hypothetical protein